MASIQDRIAALNMNHVGRTPGTPQPQPSNTSRPPPPPRTTSEPKVEQDAHGYQEMDRRATGNLPGASPPKVDTKRPPLPPPRPAAPHRQSSQASQSPALPPRKGSETALARRDSQESMASTRSAHSTMSGLTPTTSNASMSRRISNDARNDGARIKAPAVFDPSLLPPLPPKKSTSPKPPLTHSKSSTSINNTSAKQSLPPRPPVLPQRKDSAETNGHSEETPPLPTRPTPRQSEGQASSRVPPPKRSALDFGLNKSTEAAPTIPQRPGQSFSSPDTTTADAPPIPLSSKPNLADLQASKPSIAAALAPAAPTMPSQSKSGCLICRDFSGPDKHAARFSRQSIPSQDMAWLAKQLTDPFPSATDKARAIFTWLHHNVAYNIDAFLNDRVRHCTPGETISSGLAVCEGYASVFTALATHSGLESVVVSGHGKGYGYKPLKPGEAPPPFNCGHAWSAVKIDGGEWKLLDCCWGAGYIDGSNKYVKSFNASQFAMSNNDFGLTHFPKNTNHFYRTDGKTLSWEEYFVGPNGYGEDVQGCANHSKDHGIGPKTFRPRKKNIKMSGADPRTRIRFECSTVCEHWVNERHGAGKPCVLVLSLGPRGGKYGEHVPMQTNGKQWWCDLTLGELGLPGEHVTLQAVTTMNGQSARGLSIEEWKKKKGRCSMSWEGICAWELV